jgi:hypothetical protein
MKSHEQRPYLDVEARWQQFVDSAFNKAGLPEVESDRLETGTYTNAEIAEKFRNNPIKLLSLLMTVSELGDPDTKRSVLSFAVDKLI